MQVIAVPVKALERAKSRLGPILSPIERATLTMAMLEDVLDACLDQDGWQTWVVSPRGPALDLAATRGARTVPEQGGSLSRAMAQLGSELPAEAAALAVVLADLPVITASGLADLLTQAGHHGVVASPASSDGGTNVLVRRPPAVILARFGRSSFAKHRAEAYRQGVTFNEVRIPELGFDLDRPEDLVELMRWPVRSRAASACLEMGVPARLLDHRFASRLRRGA